MELNRNHYFAIGTILLLVGIQFRFVESFILNEQSSQFIEERFGKKKRPIVASRGFPNLLATVPMTTSRRPIEPPRWLGWSFISFGAVLMLYSLAMKRPN